MNKSKTKTLAKDNRILWALGFGLLLIGAVLFTSSAQAAAKSGQELVSQRVDEMKQMGGALKAIKKFIKGETDDAALIGIAAQTIKNISMSASKLFPEGTGHGDAGIVESRAKQEIWFEMDKFQDSFNQLSMAGDKLIVASKTADKGALLAALKEAGGSCGGCHKPFRMPK
jgi:cytochrome c556